MSSAIATPWLKILATDHGNRSIGWAEWIHSTPAARKPGTVCSAAAA
jgi:hypothetical protein